MNPKNTVANAITLLRSRLFENLSHWTQQAAIRRQTKIPSTQQTQQLSQPREGNPHILTVQHALQEHPDDVRRRIADCGHSE